MQVSDQRHNFLGFGQHGTIPTEYNCRHFLLQFCSYAQPSYRGLGVQIRVSVTPGHILYIYFQCQIIMQKDKVECINTAAVLSQVLENFLLELRVLLCLTIMVRGSQLSEYFNANTQKVLGGKVLFYSMCLTLSTLRKISFMFSFIKDTSE